MSQGLRVSVALLSPFRYMRMPRTCSTTCDRPKALNSTRLLMAYLLTALPVVVLIVIAVWLVVLFMFIAPSE
jgi:hypothetical protein